MELGVLKVKICRTAFGQECDRGIQSALLSAVGAFWHCKGLGEGQQLLVSGGGAFSAAAVMQQLMVNVACHWGWREHSQRQQCIPHSQSIGAGSSD